MRGHQVMPNLLQVFRALITTLCPPLVPPVLDKLLVFGFLPLCRPLSRSLPRDQESSTRMIFFPTGGHIIMSGLRVVDSTASGKWSFDHCWKCDVPSPCLPVQGFSMVSLVLREDSAWLTAVLAAHFLPDLVLLLASLMS